MVAAHKARNSSEASRRPVSRTNPMELNKLSNYINTSTTYYKTHTGWLFNEEARGNNTEIHSIRGHITKNCIPPLGAALLNNNTPLNWALELTCLPNVFLSECVCLCMDKLWWHVYPLLPGIVCVCLCILMDKLWWHVYPLIPGIVWWNNNACQHQIFILGRFSKWVLFNDTHFAWKQFNLNKYT